MAVSQLEPDALARVATDPAVEARLALDFRSDTVTQPTPEMRRAMAEAEVGDDVYSEDPCVNALEERAARLFGKEAALFVASGTQGNLLALLSQTHPGEEIVVEAATHIANNEVGGYARLGGLAIQAPSAPRGILTPEQLEVAIRPDNIHLPRTRLVAIENSHNAAGGTVYDVAAVQAIGQVARAHGLTFHVDGARIFNAAVALGVDVATLTAPADSVQFCLSKGLGAPVGSMLVASAATIAEARRYRKMVGGGMRQAGVLAAAGLVALEQSPARLIEDHRRARTLAEGLAALPGFDLDLSTVQTNIVRFSVAGAGRTASDFAAHLAPSGIQVSGGYSPSVRMVVHQHMTDESIARALEAARTFAGARA